MFKTLRPWQLAVGIFVICALVLGGLYTFRARSASTPGRMIASLPRSGMVVVYLDVNALRRAGILDLIAGSRATENVEYQQFVEGTGFDYRRDLDGIAASFSGRNSYVVLRGRFDWKKLNAYSLASGGACRNVLCRVPGPERRFASFYPLRTDTMGLAFSYNEFAALDIMPRAELEGMSEPSQPIWISVAGPALRDVPALPAGARSFVSPLESADQITMSIGPAPNGQLQVNAQVQCASEATASDLIIKLEGATNTLRKMLAREKQKPSPRDLSGVLHGGTFRREQRIVYATWPMDRQFIEALAAGAVE
jgi:hypothetical protein